MQITVEIPDDIGRAISAASGPLNRAALEALAAEAYRSGAISEQQLRRLLDLPSRFAVHEWLAGRQIPLHYSQADLELDLATLRELGVR